MGTMASRALTQKHELAKRAYNAVLSVIGSLAGSLAFLMLVSVATWIVINPGAGHSPWH
jgi:hypothetical protein